MKKFTIPLSIIIFSSLSSSYANANPNIFGSQSSPALGIPHYFKVKSLTNEQFSLFIFAEIAESYLDFYQTGDFTGTVVYTTIF